MQNSMIKRLLRLLWILAGLWYSSALLSGTEAPLATSDVSSVIENIRCESIVSEYSDKHDGIIQKRLREAYKNDTCFEQEKNTHGKPLSDAIVGPITKTWINQYMMDYTDKNCAPEDQQCTNKENRAHNGIRDNQPYSSENGIRPYVLTSDDLTYFEINADVYAALKAMESSVFITENALLSAVKSDLSSIKGMPDALLTAYVDRVRSYIQSVNRKNVTTESIDELIVNNYILAASSLQNQVDRLVNEKNFNKLIKNILHVAYLKENKQTKKDAISEKSDKVITKDKPSKKSANKKINIKKSSKSLKLSRKQKIEISKVLEIVNATSGSHLQYQLDINKEVKKEFPSISSEIIACIRDISNTGYYSRFSMKDSLKEMLRSIEKKQKGEITPEFNCKISVKTVGLKKLSDKSGDLKKTDVDYDKTTLNLLLNKAGKVFYGSNLEPVELVSFENCNECSLPMKGINYGFYPFWKASAAYRELGLPVFNPAEADFSVFSRIAYFALPVSSDGNIENFLHWKDTSNIKSFVHTLNKFNVKRDLVLYSNSWQLWGVKNGISGEKQIVQEYAEKHLAQIQKLHESVKKEGGISGITLYFDGYKSDSNVSNIVNYITHLQQQIIKGRKNRTGAAFDINMVLGIAWDYQNEQYCRVGSIDDRNNTYFKEFEPLLVSDSETQPVSQNAGEIISDVELKIKNNLKDSSSGAKKPALMNLLVFLHEPSSRAKKCLRLQIENEFHGGRRIDILRKVIPVLGRVYLKESDTAFKQFADDINYLKDNFGGIGMWPLPLSGIEDDAEVNKEIKNENAISRSVISEMRERIEEKYSEPYKNYMDYAKLGVIGDMLRRPAVADFVSMCSYMCPERRLSRYFLLLLMVGSIVSFIAYRVNCQAKKFIIKMKWIDIALKSATLVMLLSILGCDPFWQPMSNKILLSGIVLMIAYAVYRSFFCGYEKEGDEL